MPSAARKPRQQRPTAPAKFPPPDSIDGLLEENEIEDRKLRPSELEGPWNQKRQEFDADFFASQDLMSQALRDECLIYLYRLEPEVYNAAGKGSNIGKYPLPLTIEKIKKLHGGGKYDAYIKRGPRTLLRERFSVEGAPIIEIDQTTRDGKPAAPQAQTNQMSDVMRAVKEMLVETGDASHKASDGAVEIMKTGFTNALEMQAEAAKTAMNSTTGDKLTDSLLPELIRKALAPPAAAPQVDVVALMDKMVSIFSKLQRPEPPQAERISAGDQFKFVQDLLGVDNFKDILNFHERKSDAAPWWSGPLTGLAQNFPSILAWVANNQERTFQRQVYLAQLKPGEVPAAAAPGPQLVPPPTFIASPGPIPPQAQEQLIERLIGEVVRYFQAGWDGYGCAAHILMSPELAPILQQFMPVLTNEEALTQTIAQIPVLAGLAQNPVWPEFVHEFVQTIQEFTTAPRAEDDGEEESSEPIAGDVAVGGTPTPRKPRKKVVTEIKPN